LLTSQTDLDALVARAGLEGAAPLLRARARSGFHIIGGEPAPQAALGTTRLGGLPDLADGVDWPASADGLWTFYAQIDLADVVRQGGPTTLPERGLLSFFSGSIESAAVPVSACVLYAPPGARLTRRTADDFSDGCELLRPVAATFSPALSLPLDDLDFLEAVGAAAPAGSTDALIDAVIERPAETIGMLLGAAVTMQENLPAAIAFDALGRSGQDNLFQWRTWADWEAAKRMEHQMAGGGVYRPWSAADDDNVRWIQANRAMVQTEIDAWALLLRVDSNRAMDLWINDADPIFFFGRAGALSGADFGDMRARVTQG
jgi:hypothetical protein